MTPETPIKSLSITDIQKIIPHRYPMLLIDSVDIIEEGKRAIGTKCVTMNEQFFQGHFPGNPIMPGVLIIESMAQAACVMLMSMSRYKNKYAYFLGIEKAKFRNPVTPGAVLKLDVEILKAGGRSGKFKGKALVGDKIAAEAAMSFIVVDKKN